MDVNDIADFLSPILPPLVVSLGWSPLWLGLVDTRHEEVDLNDPRTIVFEKVTYTRSAKVFDLRGCDLCADDDVEEEEEEENEQEPELVAVSDGESEEEDDRT